MKLRALAWVVVGVVLGLTLIALAQQPGGPAPSPTPGAPAPQQPGGAAPGPEVGAIPADESNIVTRVYDVRELIRPKQDYPFQTIVVPPMQVGGARQDSGGGGGGSGLFGGQNQQQPDNGAVSSGALLQLVMKVIAPGTWRDAGGSQGSIAMQEGLLIVSQTAERQAQVKDLLDQLRKDLGPERTVTVKADWVLLQPGQLREVVKSGKGGPQEVDLEAVSKSKPKTRYSGQISCFNGQTVHIASVRGKTMVRDLQPVVAQQAVGYQADVTLAQAGATLQVTPQVAKDGSTAVVDLQSLVTEWDEPADPSGRLMPTTLPTDANWPWSMIDRQSVVAQQFRTTLRIPLNKPILVGGMTMSPSLKSGDSAQLYLIVEVTASGD